LAKIKSALSSKPKYNHWSGQSKDWWKLKFTPQNTLRRVGGALKQFGHKTLGKTLGIAGLSLEEGSTERILLIAAGGSALGKAGFMWGGRIHPIYGPPVGAIAGSIVGGAIAGVMGEAIDPYEGTIFTTREEIEGMSFEAPYWWNRS
jgi:hypothetical protein